jgi:hypothetical protein
VGLPAAMRICAARILELLAKLAPALPAAMPICAVRILELLAKLAPAFEPQPSQSLRMGSHPTPSWAMWAAPVGDAE